MSEEGSASTSFGSEPKSAAQSLRGAIADGFSREARRKTSEWGWSSPPDSVLELAEETLKVMSKVQKGGAAPESDRGQAQAAGLPVYDQTPHMSIHEAMLQRQDVAVYAEQSDLALMMIERTSPVVLFATMAQLMSFQREGRADRGKNPLRVALDNVEPLVGLASREVISNALKSVGTGGGLGNQEQSNVWYADASENKTTWEGREFTRLVDHALVSGATDIDFTPLRTGEYAIRIRKFGVMVEPESVNTLWPQEGAAGVLALLMSRSGANPTNTVRRLPTDGQMTYRSPSGEAHLRLSFIPLNHLGETRNLQSISVRLLPRTEAALRLADINLPDVVSDAIAEAMQMSQGLVLVVGPTNSGKSSTIAAAIGEHIAHFGLSHKRLSVEDPVERYIAGVTHFNVPPEKVLSGEDGFEILLRAIKRHDPDLLWVGEIRDRASAEMCVSSAATGHLVLSTMHANDTVMGWDVLAKMVEPDRRWQLVESVTLIVSQRLVRSLCPACRIRQKTTVAQSKNFAAYLSYLGEDARLPEETSTAKAHGCSDCNGQGYVGVVPVTEALPFTREVRDAAVLMLNGDSTKRAAIAKARTRTLLRSALKLVSDQMITVDDVFI